MLIERMMSRYLLHLFFVSDLLRITGGCTTNFGFGGACVFPYRYKGEIFFTCTVHFAPKEDGIVPMCPLTVDSITLEASTNESEWGRCNDDCPMRKYLSNEKMRETLYNLSESHPKLAYTYSLQERSVLNEELTAIKISSKVHLQRTLMKPMVRLIGNMHGNEVVGREVLVQLARLLVQGYSRDTRIRNILDNVEVHILPTMNPDGYNRGKEGECGGQDYTTGRYNENKVDLNRDFPAWFEVDNDKQKVEDILSSRQPETRAVGRWIMSEPWILGANLHDGAVVASYPWDHYTDDSKVGDHLSIDDKTFKEIARVYSSAHLTMTNSSACKKYSYLGPTTNGAAWYPKNGTLKDFGYLMSPALEFVFELSCCKFPDDYFLPREFENNRESLLQLLEISMSGVKGLVLDLSGKPSSGATVSFTQNGLSAGKDVKTSSRGEFWKILVPGRYRIKAVQSACVQSGEMPIEVPTNGQPKVVKLVLRTKFNCVK